VPDIELYILTGAQTVRQTADVSSEYLKASVHKDD